MAVAIRAMSSSGGVRRHAGIARKSNTGSPRFCRFAGSCGGDCKRCRIKGSAKSRVITRAAETDEATETKETKTEPAVADTPEPAAAPAAPPAATQKPSRKKANEKASEAVTEFQGLFEPKLQGSFGKYPEWGSTWYDDPNYERSLWAGWRKGKSEADVDKLCEQELLHGRWAMLGVTGAYASEKGTGIPWFQAGKVCTPSDCTAVNTIFPGQKIGLVPMGGSTAYETVLPNFGAVLVLTVLMMGTAEGYRAGLITPVPFPRGDYKVGDPYPGKRFDPLGFSRQNKNFLLNMKVAELKHSRLAMLSWMAYVVQAFVGAGTFNNAGSLPSYTEGAPGPYAQWQTFLADYNGSLMSQGLLVSDGVIQ